MAMLGAFGLHAVHLAVDRRARACIRAMVPRRGDLTELRERVRWFTGARADMPRSPAVGYIEKLEYLALAWGTAIMALSGFVLWFESWSLAHLPKWLLDVATVVHFYEALLATLAILVWHFYAVIFDPLVYPMDTAWLTGREAPGRTLERTASTVDPDAAADRPPEP
jgi:cytochrome b subunit of formate dehydrogenase